MGVLPAIGIRLQSIQMSDRYQQALDFLYNFVNFEHRRIDQYSPDKINLERPARLLATLGNPHHQYPAIHIAGTKGKGSVAAMCASVLRSAGLRVGLYTSPHLQDFSERIRVLTAEQADGRIDPDRFADLVERVKPALAENPELTWFELVTAIAFLHFAVEAIDIAVVEVGLGGRLDATNVLTPLVSVITSLSLDHTYLLGDTLSDIAREKGGIIKAGIPVISAPQQPEALDQLVAIAGSKGAPLSIVGRDWTFEAVGDDTRATTGAQQTAQRLIITKTPPGAAIQPPFQFSINLIGEYQRQNAVVALAALNAVWSMFPALSHQVVKKGFAQIDWPGRLQILTVGSKGPTLLVDCAHNVDSAEKLVKAWHDDFIYRKLWLIVGISLDKDIRGILSTLIPPASQVFVTASSHPRATPPAEMVSLANELGYRVKSCLSVEEAVRQAWLGAAETDLICITGSIFVVGDLLNQWESLQSEFNSSRGEQVQGSPAQT